MCPLTRGSKRSPATARALEIGGPICCTSRKIFGRSLLTRMRLAFSANPKLSSIYTRESQNCRKLYRIQLTLTSACLSGRESRGNVWHNIAKFTAKAISGVMVALLMYSAQPNAANIVRIQPYAPRNGPRGRSDQEPTGNQRKFEFHRSM